MNCSSTPHTVNLDDQASLRLQAEWAVAAFVFALTLALGLIVTGFGTEPEEFLSARAAVAAHRRSLEAEARNLALNEQVLRQNQALLEQLDPAHRFHAP